MTKIVQRIRRVLSSFGLDTFVLLIGAMIFLAWLVPKPGAAKGIWTLHNLTHYGVSLIFFFYGLGLSPAKLVVGLGNFRLHLLVHISTFLVFPILILLGYHFFAGEENRPLWLGTFYLAALPSTVSSSVIMVSLARGNIPAAIFNASLSSIMGVFLTPIWMSLFLSTNDTDFQLLGSIIDLMIIVLLPVALGMTFSRTRFGIFITAHRSITSRFDQTIVLLIIYTSFCDSFTHHVFEDYTPLKLAMIAALMVTLFFAMYGLITLACRFLRFNREDRITALFCGSKKSLMHGTAMSKVLFRGEASVGVILLPLMLYHALQLIIVSIIAKSMRRQVEDHP